METAPPASREPAVQKNVWCKNAMSQGGKKRRRCADAPASLFISERVLLPSLAPELPEKAVRWK
jgi:hypothetical protein